ncbi:orotidine-5'-phosphate decarboxylase [Desulfovermiculus halophilus]|jgi:orotidine-5'-phosphate decarboxylase|uniref:orotidine-5'-phosphate decarboxylase n=1 Tax=Desulfovermiculus halophilus TaxID=339722 RepID=UPI000484A822|nr:orotidine-5'-phosphate decarboxylase [Desulfovermiculus halophilus]
MRTPISLDKRIIFALDLDSPQLAKDWVSTLLPQIRFFKVGLELFLAGGWELVHWIQDQDAEVMLDLKFFDVPQTVRKAVQQAQKHQVSLLTVHGNDAMLQAACEAKGPARILAVTALTSLDAADLDDLGFACSAQDLVLSRARRALDLGCAGVVSSGLEVPALREHLDDRLLVVVPGVRPVQNRPVDDQKRTVSAGQAIASGADHVVIGRPIRESPDPLDTVRRLQEEIAAAS